MIDRRLFAELKNIRLYWPKTTMAAFAIVVFTLLFNWQLASLVDDVLQQVALSARPAWNSAPDWLFLLPGTVALAAFALLRALATGWADWDARQVARLLKRRLRQRLTDRFLALGPVRLKSENTGVLGTVFQEGVEAIEPYYAEFIPQLVLTGLALPLTVVLVFTQDWLSGVLMLVTAPLIPLFMVLIGNLSAAVNARQWRELKRLNGHFLDVLRGLTTLHLFGQVQTQVERVGQASQQFRRTTLGVLRVSFLSALALELTATISTAVLAVSLGVRLLYDRIDFFPAFLVLLLAPEYYQPLRQFGAKFHTATGARSATDAITSWLASESDVSAVLAVPAATPDPEPAGAHQADADQTPLIRFQGVSFAYRPEDQPILQNLDLEIPAGQHVALTGPSGAGKSTLAALLLGFLNPTQGQVKIAGRAIWSLDPAELSQLVAYLPQYPRLFADTLLNNVRLGQPAADPAAVATLLGELGLSDWLSSLPQGLETLVGPGGQPMSGGQAQRIGLARALLQNTPILVLDEPTSALDPETEYFIHRVLEARAEGKTILTIAHRQSTIRQARRVLLLDKGQIREVAR